MMPAKLEPALAAFFLSGLMSLGVSGIATLRATGPVPGFLGVWAGGWLTAWLIAFPVVLLVAPLARRAARHLVAQE